MPQRAKQPDPELAQVGRQCLARHVRQASRILTGLYDEALRPHGLRASQLNVLVAIGAHGEADPTTVGKALALEKSTVSRNAERMVTSGWLEVSSGADARTVLYRLTRKGRQLLARALPDWRQAQVEARRRLGAEGVKALTRVASSLTE